MTPSLEETIYLDFVTSSSTGAAADADSTPTAEVFEDATDTTVVALTVTKRTGKTGNYRVPVACTAANGFEAGKSYNVIASATVGGIAAKAKIGTFQVRTRDTDDLSVYAGADTTGTTTLLSRLTGTRAGLLDNLTNLDAAISSLNNLSALANLYGSPLLEIPDSATTQFAYTLVVRDSEGKLVDLDTSPTITAANAGGTDRSTNLSSVSHPATGRYTFTYGVTSAAAEESLRITVSGTVSAEARYIEWIGAVVNYDTLTTLAAVKAKTDNLPSDPADASDIAASFAVVNGTLSTIATYIDTEVAAIKAKTDNLPAAPAAVGDIPTASQNAAAVGAVAVTELASIPAASPSLLQAVALLYMALRNKLAITATTKKVHNDAGTLLGTKNVTDDGTTYNEAKMA